ncbi:MAG: hypothetical protein DWQ34_00635 [Planctomycetota bacterium]|nr:MAG: hypothetical protein DWQ34_00635 [Planctomycetota bacterium]REK25651.1 MAG: hypothetical protein DWQ41_12015 [Planctomycetota bacterium]REK31637.1 MAG: hypothetical protein DWQ45_18670 [Planctomycetota bacterium]
MLSERFEWNADDHGSDRFSLIVFCGVQSIYAWINEVSSLPPLEEIPRKSVLIRRIRENLCPVRESPESGSLQWAPAELVCN